MLADMLVKTCARGVSHSTLHSLQLFTHFFTCGGVCRSLFLNRMGILHWVASVPMFQMLLVKDTEPVLRVRSYVFPLQLPLKQYGRFIQFAWKKYHIFRFHSGKFNIQMANYQIHDVMSLPVSHPSAPWMWNVEPVLVLATMWLFMTSPLPRVCRYLDINLTSHYIQCMNLFQ